MFKKYDSSGFSVDKAKTMRYTSLSLHGRELGSGRAHMHLSSRGEVTCCNPISFTPPHPKICLKSGKYNGFTLIELLVVMAIIATLLSIAVPRYFHSLDKSKEAVLREDLNIMRDAIDKFYGDNGKYPDSLEDLVSKKYLRAIPPDPITESATSWVTTPPADALNGNVYDINSGAAGNGRDGLPYSAW